MAPGISTQYDAEIIVSTLSGEAILDLKTKQVEIRSVHEVKEHIRAACGFDVYRQQLVSPAGCLMDDESLLPLPGNSERLLLTLVLRSGHPAAVALNGVYFARTRREHEGKPIYHGHTEAGAPCQVLWTSSKGWQLRRMKELTLVPRGQGGMHPIDLGEAVTLAE